MEEQSQRRSGAHVAPGEDRQHLPTAADRFDRNLRHGAFRLSFRNVGAPSMPYSMKHQTFEPELVDVAPAPFFAGLDRASERVLSRPEMPDRVLVHRRVATADVSALHAHPKLLPHVAESLAIGATRPARLHISNVLHVRTCHWVFGLHHDEWKLTTPVFPANRLMV
jgi:hypothetical protein